MVNKLLLVINLDFVCSYFIYIGGWVSGLNRQIANLLIVYMTIRGFESLFSCQIYGFIVQLGLGHRTGSNSLIEKTLVNLNSEN